MKQATDTMTLTSSAFAQGRTIPQEFTCEGANRSPPLQWTKAPAGTKSLALVVDDPDAPDPKKPQRTFVHWVVFNLPADTTSLPAGAATGLPAGAMMGKNDWGEADWGGPCPPTGEHRYFHRIYALDTTLELTQPTKAELLEAMQGHILAEGELVGTYEKQERARAVAP